MKKSIAIVYSGFMRYYFDTFLHLCEKNNVVVDLITNDRDSLACFSLRNIYLIEENIKPKYIDSKKKGEAEIKALINVDDYDCVLADTLGLSFAYNVFHNVTLAKRMELAPNFLYKAIFYIGHFRRILLDRTYYKNCKKVFVVSSILKNDYIKNCSFSPDNVIVAYPGASFANMQDEIKFRSYDKNTPFIIGLSANGFVTKGGYVLVNALKALKKKAPYIDFRAKIIYPKHKKNLFVKLYLKILGLDKYIEFLPFQNGMEHFYNSLHCFCCSSPYEAFGRVVTEAMSYKIPVVLSSEVGASDIIADGENGFIYDVGKNISANFADKLMYIYNNYEKMENIVEKASEDVKKYTWDKFAEDIFYGIYPEFKS